MAPSGTSDEYAAFLVAVVAVEIFLIGFLVIGAQVACSKTEGLQRNALPSESAIRRAPVVATCAALFVLCISLIDMAAGQPGCPGLVMGLMAPVTVWTVALAVHLYRFTTRARRMGIALDAIVPQRQPTMPEILEQAEAEMAAPSYFWQMYRDDWPSEERAATHTHVLYFAVLLWHFVAFAVAAAIDRGGTVRVVLCDVRETEVKLAAQSGLLLVAVGTACAVQVLRLRQTLRDAEFVAYRRITAAVTVLGAGGYGLALVPGAVAEHTVVLVVVYALASCFAVCFVALSPFLPFPNAFVAKWEARLGGWLPPGAVDTSASHTPPLVELDFATGDKNE